MVRVPSRTRSRAAEAGRSAAETPNIECSSSPIEGTSEGVIIVDASIPYYGIGLVSEPIRFDVSKGRVTKISGGYQADFLDQLLGK
jgi:leucyl aminopeptidase (aminopeptidase T)